METQTSYMMTPREITREAGLIRQFSTFDYVPEARRFFSVHYEQALQLLLLATLQKPYAGIANALQLAA